MAKKGRPSAYTPELGDLICERLAAGKSLLEVCEMPDIPVAEATVRSWATDPEHPFSAKYVRAREVGWMRVADEIMRISDDGSNDSYKDEEGNVRVDHDVIARSRLRVDTRKWLLSKMLPKVFGDKLEVGGPNGAPMQIIVNSGVPRAE